MPDLTPASSARRNFPETITCPICHESDIDDPGSHLADRGHHPWRNGEVPENIRGLI